MSTALIEAEQEVNAAKLFISKNGKHTSNRSMHTPAFVDCLIEPAGWQNRQRRWTAMLSFLGQVVGVGILALIPLMFTDVLPPQQLVTFLVAPPPPPPPPPPPTAVAPARVKLFVGEIVSGRLVAPTKIPSTIKMVKEEEDPPAPVGFGVPGGVAGGVAGGQLGGVLGGIINSGGSRSQIVPEVAPAPNRVRVSEGVSAGQLINKVQPQYPGIARDARIQGTVELTAWITKDGTIERLTVVRGHPMLINAALDAVKQWRWRPFKLNGEPIGVETSVTVVFSMS